MNDNRRIWTIALIVALASVILVACGKEEPALPTPIPATPKPIATSTPSVSDHFDLGKEYLDQDQFDKAIAEFEEVIRLEPDNATAHYNLGLAYHGQNKIDEAITAYQEAIKIDPDLAAAHTNLGVAYKSQGRLDDAISEYHTAIELDPDDETSLYNLALIYYELGQLDQAIAKYVEAIRVNPDNADAHYNLGRAYHEQGDLDSAIAEWQETVRIEPEDSMTHNNLGRAYFEQGKLDQAVAELEQAIELDSENDLAYLNLGLVYRSLGQVDDAIAAFETFLQLVPSDDSRRELVEREVANLKAGGEQVVEYRNADGGYSVLYPESLYHDEDNAWAAFAASQVALDAVFDYSTDEAIQESPVVMLDALPLAELADDLDLEETATPNEFLQTMAESLEAETGDIETGTVAGYSAALAEISGTYVETPYAGALAIIVVEERVIGITAMASPDQWEGFRSTFISMLNSLSFFEP